MVGGLLILFFLTGTPVQSHAGELEDSSASWEGAVSQPLGISDARQDVVAKSLAHYIIGLMYDWLDMTEEAIEEFQEAVRYDPENYIIHLRLGADYARTNKIPEAIKELGLATELNKDDLQGHYLLALIYSTQKEFDKAAGEYELILKQFSKFDPKNIEIHGYLGQLYYSQRKFDKAIEQFKSILALEPANTDMLYMLGSLYLEINDRKSAIEQFKKAIEIDPSHDGCLNSLAYVYAEDGNHLDEALTLVQRALKINPQSGAYLDSLGWIYFKKGMYTEALENLKKADGYIKDSVIYDHLGDVYFQMNELENARKYWKLSLDLYPEQDEVREKLKALSTEQASKLP